MLFGGDTHALIPLYAVGVFLSFTLSQASMVRRWLARREAGWRWRWWLNAVGAATTGLVMLVIAVTKFTHGAWIVVLLIPLLVGALHDRSTATTRTWPASSRSTTTAGRRPSTTPCSCWSATSTAACVAALQYAQTLSPSVKAVYVETGPGADPAARGEVGQVGARRPPGGADLALPVAARARSSTTSTTSSRWASDHMVTIVIPEFMPARWWQHLLHNQTALLIKGALLFRKGVVVVDVPFHLR